MSAATFSPDGYLISKPSVIFCNPEHIEDYLPDYVKKYKPDLLTEFIWNYTSLPDDLSALSLDHTVRPLVFQCCGCFINS